MSPLRFFSISSCAAVLVLAGCSTDDITAPRIPWQSSEAPPPPLHTEPQLRVRIRTNLDTVRLEGAKAGEVLAIRPVGGGLGYQLTAPITVRSGPSGIAVIAQDRRAQSFPPGTDIECSVVTKAGNAGFVRVDGKPASGVIVVRPDWTRAPGRFDVILSVGIESYLPTALAVQSAGVGAGWPAAAWEAQAVAFRSVLLLDQRLANANKLPFDFDAANAAFQTNLVPTSQIQAAAESTRGMAVFDESGQPLNAVSTLVCGGRPASAAAVWPTGPGYEYNKAAPLQAAVRVHDCAISSHYRWTIVRPTDETALRLRAWAATADHPMKALGRLRSIEVSKRSATQRPVMYRVTDDKFKRYEIGAEQLRIALDYPVVGAVGVASHPTPIRSSDMEIEVNVTDLRIDGRGEGSGVGLCQWCSKGMAERGVSWRQMLSTFYPGSQVSKAY